MLNANRTLHGGLLAQQGEIALLLMPGPRGDAFEHKRGSANRWIYRIPCQRQQQLRSAGGMIPETLILNHGFPCRRWMHAPGHRHVGCTHNQTLQSLSDLNSTHGPQTETGRVPVFFMGVNRNPLDGSPHDQLGETRESLEGPRQLDHGRANRSHRTKEGHLLSRGSLF